MAPLMLCLLVFVTRCANAQENVTSVETTIETTVATTSTSTTTETPIQEVVATEGLSETLICDNGNDKADSPPTYCNFNHPNHNGCFWKTKEKACSENIEGKLDQHCSIVIKRVELVDEGIWECDSSKTSKKFQVKVKPAEVELKLQDEQIENKVSMTLGQQQNNQVLECGLENYEVSQLTFSWTKTVQGSRQPVDLGITEHSLALNEIDLKFQDVGQKIQCLVQLKTSPNAPKRKSKEIELDLKFPPQPTDYEVQYTTSDNPSFRTNMKILLWANPKPTVDTKNYKVEPIQTGRWSIAFPEDVESTKFVLETKNTLGKARYTFEGSHSATELVAPPEKLSLVIDRVETVDSTQTQLNWNQEHEAECQVHPINPKYTIFYTWKLDNDVVQSSTLSALQLSDHINPTKDTGSVLRCEISYQDQAFDLEQGEKPPSVETVLKIDYNPMVIMKFLNGTEIQNNDLIHFNLAKNSALNLMCSTKDFHGTENWFWYRGNTLVLEAKTSVNFILKPEDHDSFIKCQVQASDGRKYSAQVHLDLAFKPAEQVDPKAFDIPDDRYEAKISMKFLARPKPTKVIWIIEDIIVPMNHSNDGFTSSELIQSDGRSEFEIKLNFPMKTSMNKKIYYLNVTNDIGMTSYQWKMQVYQSKQISSVLLVSLGIIGFFILILIYFSVFRNSGAGSGIRRVFSYIVDQCSEFKDYYTPEALNLERQRQSLGVYTLERNFRDSELPRFRNSNPDPDTVTMISALDSEPGVVTHRSGFSDVPLN